MTKTNNINGFKYTLKGSNKWIEIKYTQKGDLYFMLNGRREKLANYSRTNSHWNNNPELFSLGIHGLCQTEYYNPRGIELSDTGEAVKVWYFESERIEG